MVIQFDDLCWVGVIVELIDYIIVIVKLNECGDLVQWLMWVCQWIIDLQVCVVIVGLFKQGKS